MPLIDIRLSADLSESDAKGLKAESSRCMSELTGKNEKFILVLLGTSSGWMDGNDDPVAFVDIRGIGGLHEIANGRIADAFCKLIYERTGISPERTYLNFSSIKGYNWGWNHKTLGR